MVGLTASRFLRRFAVIAAARRGAMLSEGCVGTRALNTLRKNKNKPGTMAAPPHRNLWCLSDIYTQRFTNTRRAARSDGIQVQRYIICPRAQLQSEPADDNTKAKLCSRRAHADTHRADLDLENTQRNDSSSPTGGFTDSKDTLT